ncbi:LysR family transcriptional regulator [alpha proteobacterium AAP81b]|nr:LysR family transcriptional regulator [alpha proteobacterium AAP81b]
MDRLETMKAFVAVAHAGSFAGAARQLRLSPSAVTRAVGELESHLGLTLFNRSTRVVSLTERGRIHLDSVRAILDEIVAAEARVRGQDAAPRGLLTVTAPVVFGRLHVLAIVNTMLAAHPALSVRLVLVDRDINLVEEGIDVAIRIGALADSSLIATKLGEVCRAVVASPAYLARRGVPATPADIADHDIIAFDGLSSGLEWHFADTSIRTAPRLAVNSADAAIAAAEAGLGITRTLSYQLRDAVTAGRLQLLLGGFTPPPVPVSALYPPRRYTSPNVTAFLAAARARFRAAPLVPAAAWGIAAIR